MGYFRLASIAVGVIYLVLQATGDVCPRYPPSSCHGPFTIRPSSPKKRPDDNICSRDQAVMESCLKQCMEDLCCRAFGVEDGKCTRVNFHTEAYDFVKEASKWPVPRDQCLSEEANCTVSVGVDGGNPFSLRQTFIDAASDLRAISGEFNDFHLVKIETDYGKGFVCSKVLGPGVESFRCELEAGEYITGVTGYMYLLHNQWPVIGGIEFTTTLKTCGPYGLVSDLVYTASGHMLLYVAGYAHGGFDKLEFTFDKC